jgi:hypothetical protein
MLCYCSVNLLSHYRDSVTYHFVNFVYFYPECVWGGALSSGGKVAGGMKLTAHLHLVPRLIMHGFIPPLLQYAFMKWCLIKQDICFHGMVLSEAQGQLCMSVTYFECKE